MRMTDQTETRDSSDVDDLIVRRADRATSRRSASRAGLTDDDASFLEWKH
jgi:hypothetical protein